VRAGPARRPQRLGAGVMAYLSDADVNQYMSGGFPVPVLQQPSWDTPWTPHVAFLPKCLMSRHS